MFTSRRIATMGGDKFRDEYSLAFDGTNDYVAMDGFAINDVLAEDDAWAIGFWFKSSQSDVSSASEIIFSVNGSTYGNIIRIGNNANASGAHVNGGIFYDDGRISSPVCVTDADDPDDGTQYTDGQWHQVVVTRPSGAGMQNTEVYIDGKLQGYSWDTNDGTAHNSGQFHTDPQWGNGEFLSIGQEWDSGPANTDFFVGNVSEVFIYNKHMTQSQVKTIYNGREPYNHKEGIASGNLKAWWRMGDGTFDSRSLRGLGAGHSDLQCITDEVTPTLGASLWDAGADVFTSGTYNWSAYGNNTIENDSNTLKVTYVDNSNGAVVDLKSGHDLSSDLTVGKVYKIKFDAKVNTGSVGFHASSGSGSDDLTWTVENTSFQTHEGYFLCGHATNCYFRCRDFGSGEIAWIDNLSLQEVGGNAGVMQNMDIGDFEGDTP